MIAAAAALERAAELTSDPGRKGERLIRAAEVAYELGLIDVVRRLLAQGGPMEVRPMEAARLEWLRLMIAGDFWSQPGVTRAFVTIAEQMAEGGDPDMALRSLVPIAHRCWWVRSKPRTRRYLVDAAGQIGVADDDPRLLAVIALADPEATGQEVRRRLVRLPTGQLADPVAEMYRGIAAEKAGDFAGGADSSRAPSTVFASTVRSGCSPRHWCTTHGSRPTPAIGRPRRRPAAKRRPSPTKPGSRSTD